MNVYGWIFMTLSWVSIFALIIFCFSRIFRNKENSEPDTN